jgi:non-ribosomal peptide synthetase component F
VDYAAWQRQWVTSEVVEEQLAYWRTKLEGAPAVLALPADRSRPDVSSTRGAEHIALLPPELEAAVVALSRGAATTSFMTMLAVFQSVVHRYTGQEDFLIGTDVAGRSRVQTEALIGCLVNLLVLRSDLAGDPSFTELLRRVRSNCLDAYAHQDVPFEKLVEDLRPERSLSYQPLVQVLFVQQSVPRFDAGVAGLELSTFRLSLPSKFDLAVFVSHTQRGLAATWTYNPDLFDASTIVRMSNAYEAALQMAASDPEIRLSALAAGMRDAERKQREAERRDFEELTRGKLSRVRRLAVDAGGRATS